jgi:DNA-binding SARP family transcriptional activator
MSTSTHRPAPTARPGPATRTVRLRVLPRLELYVGRRRLRLVGRQERVLALLALSRGRVLRTTAARTLWPDAPTRRAQASLRTSLWGLPRTPRLVDTSEAASIALVPTVHVDLAEALAVAERLLGPAPGEVPRELPPFLVACGLLEDWDEEWVRIEQERFRQLRLLALESLCALASEQGRYPQAVEAGLAALAGDPLRERAHLLLVQAHLAAGNRGEALRQYERCARLLHDELGLEPSPAMEALRRAAGPTVRRLATGR